MSGRREIKLCREGVYYLIVMTGLLAGASFRQINLLMLVGCLLTGPLLFSLIYGRLALRRIKLERRLPTQLLAGERLMVDISLTNLRRWVSIWTLAVEDVVEREGSDARMSKPAGARVYFPRVAAGETRQVSYQGRLGERGRYLFGPLRVSTRFPLGLFRHSLLLDAPDTLVVLPKLGRLARDWADTVIHENDRGSRPLARRGSLEGDYFGLRDWRPGDSRRWIHWRTTARRGALVVRQFERRRSQDLAILLDLWEPADPSQQQLENVETAVGLVATLISETCRRPGRHLTFCAAALAPLHRSGPASPYFFREQMDTLALVAGHGQDDFPALLGHAVALISPSTPILLVSTREIDMAAFRAAAAERNALLAGRLLQCINVDSPDLSRYFQESPEPAG